MRGRENSLVSAAVSAGDDRGAPAVGRFGFGAVGADSESAAGRVMPPPVARRTDRRCLPGRSSIRISPEPDVPLLSLARLRGQREPVTPDSSGQESGANLPDSATVLTGEEIPETREGLQ